MKTIVTLLAILMITGIAIAQLTPQEETDVRQLLANKQKIIDVVKTLNLETVPLEIATLRKAREAKIAERDAELTVVDVAKQNEKKTIEANYEAQIDAIEADISSKQALL